MDDVVESLERLPEALRIAFAAGCAQRVYPIYVRVVNEVDPSVKRAIEAAWSVASGVVLSEAEAKRLLDELERGTPDPEGSDNAGISSFFAANSAGAALDAALDRRARTAAGAAASALSAVENFDSDSRQGAAEERDWQQRALHLLAGRGAEPPSARMFATLGPGKPGWLLRGDGEDG